ncbi:MAG: hypothetical protein QOK42_2061 [Frankiaceae bacterium]|nr:hypothetical protein [Frankiaceae bacterium]MDX6274837.1 hypothetical protein [Frankiales bacterium]
MAREMALREEVEAAYEVARKKVIGGGVAPSSSQLTADQVEVMQRLERAEKALDAHRAGRAQQGRGRRTL